MKLLPGKTVIVTNAANEIGEAIALKFATNGANIAFTFENKKTEKKAKTLEKKLINLGVKTAAYYVENHAYTSCESMVNDVLKTFGQIDICINNFDDKSKETSLQNLNTEKWKTAILENLNSVFIMTKLVMRPMMKAKNGCIINMSSIVGEVGSASRSSASAIQAGIIGFTKSTARELGRKNIRCNAIAQGIVETSVSKHFTNISDAAAFKQNIPLGRFASVEDVANCTLLVASDLASYITGQIFSVCGGLNI